MVMPREQFFTYRFVDGSVGEWFLLVIGVPSLLVLLSSRHLMLL